MLNFLKISTFDPHPPLSENNLAFSSFETFIKTRQGMKYTLEWDVKGNYKRNWPLLRA